MRVAFLLLLVSLTSCDLLSSANSTVEEGNELYLAGDYSAAATRYEEAREEIPERAELFFDLGTSRLALESYDEATTAFSRALESAPDGLRPAIYANLGLAQLSKALSLEDQEERRQALAGALEALEKAVMLQPDLPNARRNLELTLLHLFPPCHKREDELEPNDSPDQAAEAARTADAALMLCPGTEDFFKYELEPGDRLTVTVTQTPGEAGPPATRLLDSGGTVAATGESHGDETVAGLESPEGGTYFLRVFEEDEEEHPYQVTHEVLPDCTRLQEPTEPNDSRPEASPLDIRGGKQETEGEEGSSGQQQPPTTGTRICPGDHDWYRFELKQYESLLVQVVSQPVQGELLAQLVDDRGTRLAEGRQVDLPQSGPTTPGSGEAESKALMLTLLDARSDRELFLHIYGDTPESEAPAAIVALVRPPCPAGDDDLEDNDSRDQAHEWSMAGQAANPPGGATAAGGIPGAPAAPGDPQDGAEAGRQQQLLRRCPGDDDWFLLRLRKEEQVEIRASFDHDKGDLKLELYEGEEETPAAVSNQSSADRPGEGLRVGAPEDTDYYLRITGDDEVTNFYQLSIAPPQGQQGDSPNEEEQEKEQEKEDKQEEKQEKEQKKPIEQMMDQLDRQKRPNLEAQKALKGLPNVQTPGGKAW